MAALAGDATPVVVEDLSMVLALLDERRANLAAHRSRLVNRLHGPFDRSVDRQLPQPAETAES